jgi:hypothetical protein
MTATMTLSGYRQTDLPLLTGHWLPGELLAVPLAQWPALAAPTVIAPPDKQPDQRLCLIRGLGFIRFVELDWVHRRARLEIGVHESTVDSLETMVRLAVGHGFEVLNLRRLFGWRTPMAGVPAGPLSRAGFVREGVVPRGSWLAGQQIDQEIWGVVRDA